MARTGSPKPAAEQKKLPGIFLSYRRTDNPDATGRIYDRLVSEFGKKRVFKDVDSIPLGQDFRGHLNGVVSGCAAMLAIIGPRWTDARNSAGQRRLEDADDFVRIELEAALARDIPVVPVLVGHATMPGAADLPPSLLSMVYRQSIEVRPDPDFHNDCTRLVEALKRILDPTVKDAEDHAPVVTTRTGVVSRRRLLGETALGAAAVALGIPAWKYLRETPPPEMRTDIVTPDTDDPGGFALSPDGRQIVYVGGKGESTQLWLRLLEATSARPLPGTEGGSNPFWSPDSRSIAFFADKKLMRLDLAAGQPRSLTTAALPLNVPHGTWSKDDVILFRWGRGSPLERIDARRSGTSTEVVSSASGTVSSPQFLPDGRQFLFLIRNGSKVGTWLGSLDGRPPVLVTSESAHFAYLPSGWMLRNKNNGALEAQRLDLKKPALVGKAVALADGVTLRASVSQTGLVAYRTDMVKPRQLRWVDQSGNSKGTLGKLDTTNTLSAPRISPVDDQVAVTLEGFILLLGGARDHRLDFDEATKPVLPVMPIWSPDGALVFTSNRNGDLYGQLASGGASERLVPTPGGALVATSWSPDKDKPFVLYTSTRSGMNNAKKTDDGLWILPMTGDRKPVPFLDEQGVNERAGEFSPDGRWVAYQSDKSERTEVYVRRFVLPGATQTGSQAGAAESPVLVSTAGGHSPVWRPGKDKGLEIYYIDPSGSMMAVTLTVAGNLPTPGASRHLFKTDLVEAGDRRQYDVARDGRFLLNSYVGGGVLPPITLIHDWNPEEKQ